MKADPTHQRMLLDLQEIDNHIRANARARASIAESEQRDTLAAEVSSLAPAFISASGVREDLQAEISRIEDDVRMVDSRLAQDIERRDHSASAKDIAGFEHEIATLVGRKQQLEESELVLMQRLEDAEKDLASVVERRQELSIEVSRLESVIESARSRLEAEAASLRDERAVVIAKIDQSLVALYEKQLQRYGIGAALLARGVSGGSGVALTARDLDTIKHAAVDDVVLCPDSNCILVRTEESGL